MKVSFFRTYFETKPSRVILLEDWLFAEDFKEEVQYIRCCTEQAEVDRLKKKLPCITPAGVFSSRSVDHLQEFSGFMCVDIDKLELTDEELYELKFSIGESFPSIYYAGLSVSGKGLFLIVHIPSEKSYSESYLAFSHDLKELFNLNTDHTCKHNSRLRLISYDPEPYFNPEPSIYEKIRLSQFSNQTPNRTPEEQKNTRKRVELLVSHIAQNSVDITDEYSDWVSIGKSLAAEYGKEPDGEYYFHLVSRVSNKYDEGECAEQYAKCLKHRRNTSIATFFYICRKHKVVLPNR